MRLLFILLSRWPLPALHALGAGIAGMLWLTHSRRRAVALRNVTACFPELDRRQQRRLARRALGHEMKAFAELPLVWLGPDRRVRRLTRETRGLERVDEALAAGRGLILLAAHQGGFEAALMPFTIDHPVIGVYKPQKGVIDELACRGRSRYRGELVPAIGGSVRQQLLPILAANRITYVMPDQDPPRGRGVFAPFFGIQAHSPTLVSKLIQASGARVLYVFGERLPRGRGYILHFLPPPAAIYDRDLHTSVTALNAGLEACVRLQPDQYWWGYRRFRRRPEGEPDFYGRRPPARPAPVSVRD